MLTLTSTQHEISINDTMSLIEPTGESDEAFNENLDERACEIMAKSLKDMMTELQHHVYGSIHLTSAAAAAAAAASAASAALLPLLPCCC